MARKVYTPKQMAANAKRRMKSIDKASDLIVAGVRFNNDSISDETRIAAAQKLGRIGKVSTMGKKKR